MAILLSSANKSVITRWESLLGGQYPLEQATLLRELKSRCTEKVFDLILLHRPLVDMAAFSELRRATPLSKFFLLSDQPNEEEAIALLKSGKNLRLHPTCIIMSALDVEASPFAKRICGKASRPDREISHEQN